MPKRYNINPIKDFDLTEYEAKKPGPVGDIDWGDIGGTLSNQGDLQSALDSKVNDTGDTMTGDLAFTNAGINNANQVTFNTSATETISEGVMSYNSNTGNLELGLAGGNVAVGLGKELVLPRRVKNSSGTTMFKGTVVYISGVDGNTPVVSRAIANSDATSAFTIGVCAENINDGNTGWILTNGLLAGYNFSTYSVGDILYLSGTNAGEFTTTKPQAPTHYVRIGEVTKATASGEAIITILNGYELDELHNVQINSVQTGQILQYQTDGLWKNVTLSGVITNHNDLQGIQGGTTNQYYHLTNSELTTLQATSGTNTGDVTVIDTTTVDLTLSGQILQANVNPTGITHNSLSELQGGIIGEFNHLTNDELTVVKATSGSNSGDVSVIDSDTITFVLSGQELTADVIPAGFEGEITHNNLFGLQGGVSGQYNHLTNAQLTVVQNTSGVNTGDQVVPQDSAGIINNFLTSYDATTGAFNRARPTWANIDKTTSPISDLSNVSATTAEDGQALVFNGVSNQWENETLPTQINLIENANQINNSTNGYGALSDGWAETNTTSVQGGFPDVDWNGIWDTGNFTGIWYLNETSGSAIDDNGIYTLTQSSAISSSKTNSLMANNRITNGANRFSGTVSIGNVVGNQTFIAYVRPSNPATGTVQHICGWHDGTRFATLSIGTTGKAQFYMSGLTANVITSDVTLEANKWYLLIGSYSADDTELRLYVNGVYKRNGVAGTHTLPTSNVFQIGQANSANGYSGNLNCVAHIYNNAWDLEKMNSLFAKTLYSGVKILRTDTTSEISNFQLLPREDMYKYTGKTIIFSAEVYQEASSNAKLTIYGSGMGNQDSTAVTATGTWVSVSVIANIPSSLPEIYFNLRSSSGTAGAIWYRNIRVNYGTTPISFGVHNPNDWIKFPRLLNLDIPDMYEGRPYQYQEDRWYPYTTVCTPAGTSASQANVEWKYKGNTCYIKGQLTQTMTSTTWTHTLPIYTGLNEVAYTRFLKIQNNAGTQAVGNWAQLSPGSGNASLYATIANGTWSATSGVKIVQLDNIFWEID